MATPFRWWCPLLRVRPSTQSRTVRPRAQRLEDRCTPATIGEIPLSTNLPAPQGIVQGNDGAMWFTDAGSNKIGRITLDETELLLDEPGSCLRPSPTPIPLADTFEPELRYFLGDEGYENLRKL